MRLISGYHQEIIFEQIAAERERQDKLHPLPAGFPNGPGMRLAILMEEVGEVGKAVSEEKPVDMREELIQVAAVAVRWLELIDANSIADMHVCNLRRTRPTEDELALYRAAIRRKTL